MNTMHQEGNALIYENDGELLRIEPWGKNSLRVRSVMQGSICDTDYAPVSYTHLDVYKRQINMLYKFRN